VSDREAFIAAVIARPDDDLPRLVFADWLDEHGEPEWAEFIRVQCKLADGTLGPCAYEPGGYGESFGVCTCCRCALSRRELSLLDVMYARTSLWIGDRCRGAVPFNSFSLSRGFVNDLAISWQDWYRHAAGILANCPIRQRKVEGKCVGCNGTGVWGFSHVVGDRRCQCHACCGTGRTTTWVAGSGGLVRLSGWPTGWMAPRRGNPAEPLLHPDYPGVVFVMPLVSELPWHDLF
jgi:uncharacterized protein (TIGR02996 family)